MESKRVSWRILSQDKVRVEERALLRLVLKARHEQTTTLERKKVPASRAHPIDSLRLI
jgi:hypothetical protein